MSTVRFLGELVASSVAVTARRTAHGRARPSWSWGFEVVADALKKRSRQIAPLDWPAQRAAWASLSRPSPVVRAVRREDLQIEHLRAAWFSPRGGPRSESIVLYLHGGSYIYGSIDTHLEVIARIVSATRGRVLAVDYRLAPEHPFPAALDDAVAAYRWLAAREPSQRIVIAGDSAGGGLALSTLVALRDEGAPRPAGAILISPWVDLAARGGTLESNAAYDWAEPQDFVLWADTYLAGASPRDPRASPTYADLSSLPPLLVFLGGAEMLRDQVTELASRARAAGTRVDLEIEPDMIHNGPSFAGLFARCRKAYEHVAAFVAEITA